jgi:hypothetical protein
VRYERQLVLREWGTAGQAALEAARAELPCAGAELAVAERYLQAAGVAAVIGAPREGGDGAGAFGPAAGPFASALAGLPWHAEESRSVGLGAAYAVDFLATTLREVRR